MEFFNPIFLSYGIEINLYIEHCEAQFPGICHLCNIVTTNLKGRWNALVSFSNEVYDAVKARYPNLIAFPSIALYPNITTSADCAASIYSGTMCIKTQINGHKDGCIDTHIEYLHGLKRDRIAVSTYPYGPDDYPPDWYCPHSS